MSEQSEVFIQRKLKQFNAIVKSDFTVEKLLYDIIPVDLSLQSITITLSENAPNGSTCTVIVKKQNETSFNNITFSSSSASKLNVSLNDCAQVMIGASSKTINKPLVGYNYECFFDDGIWYVNGVGEIVDVIACTNDATFSLANCNQLHALTLTQNATITFPEPLAGACIDMVIVSVASNNLTLTFNCATGSSVQVTTIKVGTISLNQTNTISSLSNPIKVALGLILRSVCDGKNWYVHGHAKN